MSEPYDQVLELLQVGKTEEAIECIKKYKIVKLNLLTYSGELKKFKGTKKLVKALEESIFVSISEAKENVKSKYRY